MNRAYWICTNESPTAGTAGDSSQFMAEQTKASDFCDGPGIVFHKCDIIIPSYGELDETGALIKTIGSLRKTDNGYTYEESSQ